MSVLTLKDIKTVVTRALGPKVTIVSHRLEDFTKEKNGIFGTHQLLVVEVEDGSYEKKTESFFVKTRPESALIMDTLLDEETFLEEIHFFAQVHPLMMKDYQGERWSPRCFLANKNVLVFEDLRVQGFTHRTKNILDEQSLKSALSSLARFHASSQLAEKRLGKSLKEVFPSAFGEKVYNNGNKFGQSTSCGYETITLMAEKLGLNSGLVSRIHEKASKLVKPAVGKLNVLCHSDLWMNNVLFNDSVPAKCILVDFQLLRYASPVIDFCMLVYLHTTPDYRKKNNLELLQYYHSVLRDVLLRSEIKPKIPSFENLLSDFNEYKLAGMAYASLYLPGIYLNPEDFGTLLNDPTALQKFMFTTRMDLIGPAMDKDPVYREKLRGIIEELLEEAERVFG
ncbi:uncharacterized protein LOC100679888 [Nasonia vitripennis]|uniref:CHK kinase-like domain-containing protein n=1 Tax=Nasonia vitripennis TaxID=7425 RepID=A0A7M7H6I8_NASVI|nr:uncharacterized protein LOC100679888 [Nasonia vitripennis]